MKHTKRLATKSRKSIASLSITMALLILGGCGAGSTSSGTTTTTLTDANDNPITTVQTKEPWYHQWVNY